MAFYQSNYEGSKELSTNSKIHCECKDEKNLQEYVDPPYACDLFDSWTSCCTFILFGDIDEEYKLTESQQLEKVRDHESYEEGTELYPIIDLIPEKKNEIKQNINLSQSNGPYNAYDKWTENAHIISAAINKMHDYLYREAYSFVGSFTVLNVFNSFDPKNEMIMSEADASIFESTVTSFAISTANQIDQLRQTAAADLNQNNDLKFHREGVVSILLNHLREDVMKTMSELRQIRTRIAFEQVHFLNEPLSCGKGYLSLLDRESSETTLDLKGNISNNTEEAKEMNNDQHISPPSYFEMNKEEVELQNFLKCSEGKSPFIIAKSETQSFIDNQTISKNEIGESTKKHMIMNTAKNPNFTNNQPGIVVKDKIHMTTNKTEYNDSKEDDKYIDDLVRENTLITSQIQQSTQNIDEIHQIENSMMQITTLINQFSNLISEQQEDVIMIHDTTIESKELLEKGTDKIVDATERTKKGGHYMAKAIFAMSIILWLLNWLM